MEDLIIVELGEIDYFGEKGIAYRETNKLTGLSTMYIQMGVKKVYTNITY